MNTGTVNWFNIRMGYGFIDGDCGRNIFVHYKNIISTGVKLLNSGDRVTFDLYETDKGFIAINVLKT